MANSISPPLLELLEKVVGASTSRYLQNALAVPNLSSASPVHRSVITQALNMALFAKLLKVVPDAQRYTDERIAQGVKIILDHGALRTVINVNNGQLPSGQAAFSRFLSPLGYEEAGHYPMPNLRMVGRVWCHVDLPETLSQFFVSELNVAAFSAPFQSAAARVVSESQDPLTMQSKASLARLQESQTLPIELAVPLLINLLECFERQHTNPHWEDYQCLLNESAEMAWIATEGNVFNHAADRVVQLDSTVSEQKNLDRPMKQNIEVSRDGTIRQTAYRAATVQRSFVSSDTSELQKAVSGSFFEFISRAPDPDGSGRLDLRFDAANAQGIFKMTEAKS
ncbi:MAG TPA: DUF1338 family protein [Myxococcales bacterium]|nr:DUF1338 family protein [Myxococcales bacterium]HIN85788.1 DUF1338 family protein [Myxococcales bacterium]